MTVTADQVGKLYDILIATRDGSTLSCLDHLGHAQQVAQVAYMLSTTKPSAEATELQRKDELTRFSSAQITDVYFDAWPQVEQGDWSDGQGQRVFSGQGEALGTISNKSTKYWDGQGILWPVTDYLPKRGVLATVDQNEGGARMATAGVGTVSGPMTVANTSSLAFAYVYSQVNAPQNNILVLQGDTNKVSVTNPPGTAAAGGISADMIIVGGSGSGFLLWLSWDFVTTIRLATIDGASPPNVTTVVTIANATRANLSAGTLAAGQVGNKNYVAFLWQSTATSVFNLRLIDLSGGSWTAAAVDIPLSTGVGGVPVASWTQIEFQGDNVVLAGSLYGGAGQSFLLQYNIPSGSWGTLVRFPNSNNILFCEAAGGLFALSVYRARSLNGMPDLVDAWIVQGGSAQHVGPIEIQSQDLGATQGSYVTGEGQPSVIGPYAVFPIYFFRNASTASYVAVMAYDVLRGRMFKMNELGPYDPGLLGDRRMAVIPPIQHHPFGGGTLPAQWGVAVPVLGSGGTADVTNVQRLLMNPTTPGLTFSPLLQQGVEIISSLIDFTSAQNKLYRQLVADFTPLPNDAAITIQLDCWFDQDPSKLAAVPDFTTGVIAGSSANVGLKQLRLVTNRIARKVVYRVITTGPSTAPTGAVKIISVKTQVATGWALHYFLDISRNATCNDAVGGNPTYCFQNQAPVDDFAAHAFLKQLWRLKGGECIVTLPTGETYNALLQLISAENVKHVIQSGLSDTPVVKSVIVELKIREDV